MKPKPKVVVSGPDSFYKWFPADWAGNRDLSLCSLAARAVWHEMLDVAHANGGYVLLHGKPPSMADLAKMVGATPAEVKRALEELKAAKIGAQTDKGIWFSPKMVRALARRQTNRQNGIHGGNPRLTNSDNRSLFNSDNRESRDSDNRLFKKSDKPRELETRNQNPEDQAPALAPLSEQPIEIDLDPIDEPPVAPHPAATIPPQPTRQRIHGAHAIDQNFHHRGCLGAGMFDSCRRGVCVPQKLHTEWMAQLGDDRDFFERSKYIQGVIATGLAGVPPGPIGDDAWTLYRGIWADAHPKVGKATSTGTHTTADAHKYAGLEDDHAR